MLALLGANLFVNGSPGKGKSYLIDIIKDKLEEKGVNYKVVAPTGRAALNVGGFTIHKLFPVPALYNRDSLSKYFNQDSHLSILKDLDVLIIDEIGMVRSDYFTFMDDYLRSVKSCNKPFGGTQVIAVGDFYQIEPVVTDKDEELFKYYRSAFCFSSPSWEEASFQEVELTKDIRLIDARQSRVLESIRKKDKYYRVAVDRCNAICPRYNQEEHYDFTQITFNRYNMKQKNMLMYNNLKGEEVTFIAKETSFMKEGLKGFYYPVEKEIKLKIGTKVILKHNVYKLGRSKKPTLLAANGEIGYIVDFKRGSTVVVNFGDKVIDIPEHTWENRVFKGGISYIAGTFTQIPLDYGWAQTVHSVQGLTIDKYVLNNSSKAFCNGLYCTALTRARDLSNVVLFKDIDYSEILVSREVKDYGY